MDCNVLEMLRNYLGLAAEKFGCIRKVCVKLLVTCEPGFMMAAGKVDNNTLASSHPSLPSTLRTV